MFALLVIAALGAFANALPQRSDPESYWYDPATCGRSKYPDAGAPAVPYIVGGAISREHEFPWQVYLRTPGQATSFFCGGSIITPTYVITAAHCTDGKLASEIEVVAGEHDRSTNDLIRQLRAVITITQHASYDARTTDFDISLLRVGTAFIFNENVTYVCAPTNIDITFYHGKETQISGWGTLQSGGACCPMNLHWARINVIDNVLCQAKYTGNTITNNMVCAGTGPDFNTTDTCQGDSGGPMTFKNPSGQFELVGLTSWGIGCASGYPGVYTNLPGFKAWVNVNIP
jgi:secreted trypsin-like serine protease